MVDFFLSYCRDDAEGRWLERFYQELHTEVWRRSERKPEADVSFRDVDMEPGIYWGATTIEALSTCRVFVPLYSPHYFGSEYCGKEWWIFSQRLKRAQLPGSAQTRIVPVLWESPNHFIDELPEVVGDLQYTTAKLGPDYWEKGLRHIVRLRGHNEALYGELIRQLAGLIIEAAKQAPLPTYEGDPSFQTAVDAFRVKERASQPLPDDEHAHRRGAAESGHVYFVFAAGTADEMRPKRSSTDQYGGQSTDWRPFRPHDESPLATHACHVAGEQKLIPHPSAAGPDLAQIVEKAEKYNEIVVLLVDPWAMHVDKYRMIVESYDRTRHFRTGTVVPWPSDQETSDAAPRLTKEVHEALKNRVTQSDNCRVFVRSSPDFRRELTEILVQIQSWIMGTLRVPREATADRTIARPTLSGPPGTMSLGAGP